MYAASVSIMVLSYSFREATFRANESLMRDSLCGWARDRAQHTGGAGSLLSHNAERRQRTFQ